MTVILYDKFGNDLQPNGQDYSSKMTEQNKGKSKEEKKNVLVSGIRSEHYPSNNFGKKRAEICPKKKG